MNWASSSLGARLVDWSSQTESGEATNVLEDSNEKIWLSKAGMPQWLCISMNSLDNQNLVIRTVGWYCWHSYITNPRIVSMHVSKDGSKFRHWDSFQARSQTRGNQLFSCAPVDTSLYPYIALEITHTFGGMQTYMNRVYMYSDEVTASPESSIGSDSRRAVMMDAVSPVSESEHVIPAQINISELSYQTAEHKSSSRSHSNSNSGGHHEPLRTSADTNSVARQLQQALGISEERGDSSSDSGSDEESYLVDQRAAAMGAHTVAGRVARLEAVVNNMEHTLVVAHLSRSSSPQHTVSTQAGSSPARQASFHNGQRAGPFASPTPTVGQVQQETSRHSIGEDGELPLVRYEERMAQLEGKFERLMETLLQRQAAGALSSPRRSGSVLSPDRSQRPARPPQPPPPPTPPRNAVNASVAQSPEPRRRQGSHTSSSRTPAVTSTGTQSTPQRPTPSTLGNTASSAPWSSSTADVSTVRSIEEMLRRVLDERSPQQRDGDRHRARRHSSRSPAGAADGRHRPRSPLVGDDGSPTRHVWRAGSRIERRGAVRSQDNYSSDSDGRHSSPSHRSPQQHSKGSVLRFVQGHTARLEQLESKQQASVAAQRPQELVSERFRAYARAARESGVLQRAEQAAARRLGRHGTESESVDIHTSELESSGGEGTGSSRTSSLSPHRRRSRGDAVRRPAKVSGSSEADAARRNKPGRGADLLKSDASNALEKSIFDLLKSKYGLQEGAALDQVATAHEQMGEVRAGAEVIGASRGGHGKYHSAVRRTQTASLPMRVPAEGSSTGTAAVVDWPQYVHNRVASRTTSPAAPGSPLRPGVPGVYTVAGVIVNRSDNIDVLARAKQEQRDTRRARTPESLRPATTSTANNCDDHAPSVITTSAVNSAEATPRLVPAWCEGDAEMEALVRALHAKVYERTVKEAQYDILRLGQHQVE